MNQARFRLNGGPLHGKRVLVEAKFVNGSIAPMCEAYRFPVLDFVASPPSDSMEEAIYKVSVWEHCRKKYYVLIHSSWNEWHLLEYLSRGSFNLGSSNE